MKAFLFAIALLIRLGLPSADGQNVVLPVLSIQPKAIQADTVKFIITRSELMKLELARRTLANLDFTDIDQVITTQKKVIDECEKTLTQVVETSSRTIKTLKDSLSATRSIIQRTTTTNEQVTTTVSQTHVKLNNFASIIRDAKRFVWVQRLGAFAIGAAVGVLVPVGIKLISN